MKKQTASYQYKITTKATPKLMAFSELVWAQADIQYYGRKIDWKKENRYIHAYEGKKLIGLLELTIMSGVVHILDIVVDYEYHKHGVGTTLMQQAEEVAKKSGAHKLFLETGADWGVRKFYENLGYVKTGDLPNHFAKHDYVEYSKFL